MDKQFDVNFRSPLYVKVKISFFWCNSFVRFPFVRWVDFHFRGSILRTMIVNYYAIVRRKLLSLIGRQNKFFGNFNVFSNNFENFLTPVCWFQKINKFFWLKWSLLKNYFFKCRITTPMMQEVMNSFFSFSKNYITYLPY